MQLSLALLTHELDCIRNSSLSLVYAVLRDRCEPRQASAGNVLLFVLATVNAGAESRIDTFQQDTASLPVSLTEI